MVRMSRNNAVQENDVKFIHMLLHPIELYAIPRLGDWPVIVVSLGLTRVIGQQMTCS